MDLLKILEKPERTFKLNERVLFGAHNEVLMYPITYGILRDAPYETQLKTFIKLNTTGKTMDKKYINHAIELLNNIKK